MKFHVKNVFNFKIHFPMGNSVGIHSISNGNWEYCRLSLHLQIEKENLYCTHRFLHIRS